MAHLINLFYFSVFYSVLCLDLDFSLASYCVLWLLTISIGVSFISFHLSPPRISFFMGAEGFWAIGLTSRFRYWC